MDRYQSYSEQKRWAVDFVCPDEDARYFAAEFGDMVGPGRKIVELGFGAGRFLAFARGRGAEALGVEIQPELVARARDAGFTTAQSLEELIPDHAGTVHGVVALDVFEHLDEAATRVVLAALHTLLVPGGHVALRAPNGQSPFGRRTQYGDVTHATVVTPKKMEQVCFGSGLTVTGATNQARIPVGRTAVRRLVKRLQFLVRDLGNAAISAIWGIGTTVLDENIVIRLRKATP